MIIYYNREALNQFFFMKVAGTMVRTCASIIRHLLPGRIGSSRYDGTRTKLLVLKSLSYFGHLMLLNVYIAR